MIWPADARVDGGGGKAEEAHFLIGLCSFGPLPEARAFVYVPKAANVLREREQHIQLLNEELQRIKNWLAESQRERDELLELHHALKNELEARNRWADKLDKDLKTAGTRIVGLQDELATLTSGYEAKLAELEQENRAKTAWALETEARLTEELAAKGKELVECVRLLEAAEATVVERTHWAQRLEKERADLEAKLQMVRASRWVRLGRSMGLGPLP
jgi:DNA repair exonuclease SbcCD ATPase subunit